MSPENFVYWLQGFFEITGKVEGLTPAQLKMIQDHLGYVFSRPNPAAPTLVSPLKQPVPPIPMPGPGTTIGGQDILRQLQQHPQVGDFFPSLPVIC